MRPQKKSFAEIVRGVFVENTPILRHLAQDKTKTAKKQGEKYSYHLGNMKLRERIEEFSLARVKSEVKRNTIIAYDLTDLSKESSKKIRICPVFLTEAKEESRMGSFFTALELTTCCSSWKRTTERISHKIRFDGASLNIMQKYNLSVV